MAGQVVWNDGNANVVKPLLVSATAALLRSSIRTVFAFHPFQELVLTATSGAGDGGSMGDGGAMC